MSELETTVAAPFIHSQEGELSQARLVFYYFQDKNWMNDEEAKKLIALAERKGLLTRNEKGNFVPQPSLLTLKIPLGFKPTDAIFETGDTNVIEELLEHISSVSGIEKKDLLQQIPPILNHFDNLIVDDAAIMILAKKYGVDFAPYREKLIKHVENE